jgi:hypothetical protein
MASQLSKLLVPTPRSQRETCKIFNLTLICDLPFADRHDHGLTVQSIS